ARPRRPIAERWFPGVGFALRGSRCQCSPTYWNASEALPTLTVAGHMENEELAALRATLLAAQRQPLAVKVRQARLSALLADGEDGAHPPEIGAPPRSSITDGRRCGRGPSPFQTD